MSRILLIRPSALGDVARTVPCLVTLRRARPDATIDWLVQDGLGDVVRHHPALNNVVDFPRRQFRGLYCRPSVFFDFVTWCRQLRQRRYDLVFDLQGLARSGVFARATGAEHRVGFANARELGWFGYNHRYHVRTSLHTVDRMLALLKGHGLDPVRDMRLYLGPQQQAWQRQFALEHDLTGRPYAVLAPTAKWLCKCWPIDHYIQLARRLLESRLAGDRLIVLAAPNERAYVQPLLDAFAGQASLLAPATDVGQMMALIHGAALLVCNDSAPLHIGVGFNRPIVSIFGPTSPALVGPYGRSDTVLQPPDTCRIPGARYRHHRDDQTLIAQVTVDAAWNMACQQVRAGKGESER
ncbi:MAG: glycosyltransferase family 9 protein [Phycisphaeraceae bacterium]